jgi:hypothetical protein
MWKTSFVTNFKQFYKKLLDPWFCPLLWMFNHMDDAIVQIFKKIVKT